MSREFTFLEQIDFICQRPSMHVLNGSYQNIASLITGYSIGLENSPIESSLFNSYICKKFKFPTKYFWPFVIDNTIGTEAEKIEYLRKSIHEFVELLEKSFSEEEILNFATIYKLELEPLDPAAESVFRTFSKALLTGNKAVLQPLIVPHQKEHILWKGTYPEDVATKLDRIDSQHPIRLVKKSVDGKTVSILSASWPFQIEMIMIDGHWKVVATDIINLWDRNTE